MVGSVTGEICGIWVPTLLTTKHRELVMGWLQSRIEGNPDPATYELLMLHKDHTTRIPVGISVGVGTYHGRKTSSGTIRRM